MERRLTTIMASDIVGYSAQMGKAEESMVENLGRISDVLKRHVDEKGGRLFAQAGDGFLSEFASPVSAVRAGFEIQRELNALKSDSDDIPELRIGVHMADVVVDGDNLLGDGVNIAARVESTAEPGSVLITQPVFDQVKRTCQLTFENCGEKQLKNISDPMILYRTIGELDAHSMVSGIPEHMDTGQESGNGTIPMNSIAVLPFVNMSDDAEQEYFADGFCDDLITELARFTDLFVISRNASYTYKGRNVDVREVGKEMGVAYCVEGSVRKLGSRVRMNAQLIQTESGDHVWAEKYDFNFEDVFDVQDELAATIASVVAGKVTRRAEESIQRKKPQDMEAYECLLRGLQYHRLGGITLEDAEQAYYWFSEAVDKDPEYGRAYAWQSCSLSFVAEWKSDEALWNDVFDIGYKGVQLDDQDPECHRIAGSLDLYTRKYESAEYHFRRALEINPNHAWIVGRMGELYNFTGNPENALEYQHRAVKLDPFLPEYCRELEVAAYYLLGRYEEALQVVSELNRPTRRAASYAAAAATHLDDPEAISTARERILTLVPDYSVESFLRKEFYKDRGVQDQLGKDLLAAGLPA